MKPVDKCIRDIAKMFNDDKVNWFYGVEYSSSSKPDFKAVIQFSLRDVKPLVFGANSEKDLVKQMQKFIYDEDPKDLNVMYHESQISIDQERIRFHKNLIKQIRDNENTPS